MWHVLSHELWFFHLRHGVCPSLLFVVIVCLSWGDDRHCCQIVFVRVFSMLFVLLAACMLVLIINGGWPFPRSPSCCGHVSHCCFSLCFSLELSCFYRLLIFWSSIKLPMICRLTTRYNLTVSETCWHQLLSAVRLSFGFQLGSTGFAECNLTQKKKKYKKVEVW